MMTTIRTDAWVKSIGQKRNAPYLYLDGLQAIRAWFAPGDKFDVTIDGGKLVLSANKDGSRTVSRKMVRDREYPVIDINSRELLAIFDGMDAVRVVVRGDKVFILPLASESGKRERLQRLRAKMSSGELLSHAIHAGLAAAGIDARLCFANEIREDLMNQAATHNDAWDAGTQVMNLPMQELAQDEWLLRQLPKLEVLEMGLPCSGASRAGKSKRGHE
jgi:DNA (cytosine-5)-methyltransferase 1